MEAKVHRSWYGTGSVTINGVGRLSMFGGNSSGCTQLNSVELNNSQKKQWKTTTIELKEPSSSFGFLEVKDEIMFEVYNWF